MSGEASGSLSSLTSVTFNARLEDVKLEASPNSSLEIPDGIYYIVLADLVESTSYMAKMGNDAGIARFREFERSARLALKHALSASPNNSGRFVKTVGDAVLLVFNHFPDIVQWYLNFDGVLNVASIKTELMKARTWVHVGELRFENDDLNGLCISHLIKVEQKAKEKAEAGRVMVTDLAKQIAEPALFSEHCAFDSCGSVTLEGHPSVKLYMVTKADLPFLITKQLRDGRGKSP